MAEPELLASSWTTAGAVVPHSSDERSPEAFIDRVEAAAAAGFVGMGFGHADIVEIRDTIGFREMKAVLRQFGMKYVELEMLMDWYERGAARERAEKARNELLEAAAELGAMHVKAGCDYSGGHWPFKALARDFKDLCQRAADANTMIALEPQPMSSLKTPREAMDLVDAADQPAGGVIIDIWHVERGGVPLETLRTLPIEKIIGIELNDADQEVSGTLLEDTINHRKLCGEGSFDLRGFIETLQSCGYKRAWGIEILSIPFRKLAMKEAVQRAFDTAASQFKAIVPGVTA